MCCKCVVLCCWPQVPDKDIWYSAVKANVSVFSFWARCNASDGRHGAEGTSKRRRVTKSAPRPTAVLVHRVWIDLSSIGSRALGHKPQPSKLPDLAISCLRSWSPQPQMLWTHSAMEQYDIPGLTVMALNALMPGGIVAFMLAGNVPVQFIKDILSMRILHAHGGMFLDMDMYWLGRVIQVGADGYLFAEEPHSRKTGMFLGRSHHYPNLAMFAMPKGSDMAVHGPALGGPLVHSCPHCHSWPNAGS